MIEKIDSITKEAACMMDINVITEGINSLIRAGYYESREKLLDDAALRFAEENCVETLELHSILRSLWESGMRSKDDVGERITEIEKGDNTRIKDTGRIFQ